MTIEEFNNTGFGYGMKVKVSNHIYNIASVDFEDFTIGIEDEEAGDIKWVAIKFCEIIKEQN